MNNKINIENYEAFLLDWMEGNLSEENILLLKEFLKNHPEIRTDDDLMNQTLKITEVDFSEKNTLKKSLTDEDYIAYHEGDLPRLKKREVEEFISTNSDAKNDFEQYAKLKLQPQPIIFENKAALKKKGVVFSIKRLVYYVSSAAAMLLIAFLLLKDTGAIYTPVALSKNQLENTPTTINNESFEFLIPKEKSIKKSKTTTEKLIVKSDLKTVEKVEEIINEKNPSEKIVAHQSAETNEEFANRIEAYFNYISTLQSEENSIVTQEDVAPQKLTVKEFLVSKFKKHILKVDDETPTKLEVNDFAKTLANVSNNKIFIEKKGDEEHLKMYTKLFSFDKKISN